MQAANFPDTGGLVEPYKNMSGATHEYSALRWPTFVFTPAGRVVGCDSTAISSGLRLPNNGYWNDGDADCKVVDDHVSLMDVTVTPQTGNPFTFEAVPQHRITRTARVPGSRMTLSQNTEVLFGPTCSTRPGLPTSCTTRASCATTSKAYATVPWRQCAPWRRCATACPSRPAAAVLQGRLPPGALVLARNTGGLEYAFQNVNLNYDELLEPEPDPWYGPSGSAPRLLRPRLPRLLRPRLLRPRLRKYSTAWPRPWTTTPTRTAGSATGTEAASRPGSTRRRARSATSSRTACSGRCRSFKTHASSRPGPWLGTSRTT